MATINNILAIVDPGTQEQPAVQKAARLAECFNARLELFACETKESRAARYAAHLEQGKPGDFIAHVRTVLEEIARPLRQRGIDVAIETAAGDPLHAQLLDRTRTTCADLVVKDTHHHSIARRTFMTNTDWQLIRGCPVPLLLTKARSWPDAPVMAAALDPNHANDKPAELDHRILDWARTLCARLGGELHAVHAYLPAVLVAETSAMPAMVTSLTPQMMEAERQRELERLVALAGPYQVDRKRTHAQLGVPSDVLPRIAQSLGLDIMVMGAISRSGLKRVFIGSTAERVLEHLPCDVLVIKPPDFAAAWPY